MLADLRAHFVVESSTEVGEGLVVEHTPDNAVVEGEVTPLELGDAVVALAVLHVEEAKVRKDAHKDGLRLVRELGVVGVGGEACHEPSCASLEVGTHDVLLSGVDLQDALLEGIVYEFLSDELFCYHDSLYLRAAMTLQHT